MAVYDGFFDAVADEETGEFDRSYSSGSFTDYFAHIIGSGVCIHNNQDSFKVRFEGGNAVVSPGYLFIQGYWLKNDADYTVPVTGDATLAIVAHLNMGSRMIEIEAVSVAQAYPDSLVLGLVNPTAGTAEDTRNNTDICGVIDTAGELSKKVEWAVNYIDNEVENRLNSIEIDIAEKSAENDAKIAAAKTEADNKISAFNEEVSDQIASIQAEVDKISPPPIGSIKFSASQNIEPGWLRCDGSFISESQYPELVAALGKLTPSADRFHLISEGEIGPQISNGVLYGGRMWVYSFSEKKLYGVDVVGTDAVKEISITSEDSEFLQFTAPTTSSPLALSIVPSASGGNTTKLFLAQNQETLLIFSAEFNTNLDSLSLSKPFSKKVSSSYTAVPYVSSNIVDGVENFYCAAQGKGSDSSQSIVYMRWTGTDDVEISKFPHESSSYKYSSYYRTQRVSFSKKSGGDCVFVDSYFKQIVSSSAGVYEAGIRSTPSGLFNRGFSDRSHDIGDIVSIPNALNVVGEKAVLFEITPSAGLAISRTSISPPVRFSTGVSVPSFARCFVDGAAYLWGKAIYMIFVGTGIIFSRELTAGSFGYLDTTSVLGTITQFGYLDYSQDENTLYLLGQDTDNKVKVAKMELNTLFDYANDGAWLPTIASDGVPAYIKAKEVT